MNRTKPTGPEPLDDVEVWEPDVTSQVQLRIGAAGARRRLSLSVPGAVAGALLVCALAFGSSLGAGGRDASTAGDRTSTAADEHVSGGELAVVGLGGDGNGSRDDRASGGVEATPGIEETEPVPAEPATEPTGETDPTGEPTAIGLTLGLRDGDVKLAWTGCEVDGFVAWTVVRSTDAGATYPLGEGDSLVAVIEKAGRRSLIDEKAPAHRKLWYALFGLSRQGGETYLACSADDASIVTPRTPEPTPKPTEKPAPEKPAPETPVLGLTLAIREGRVYLDWTACEIDGAQAYKVVRSTDSGVRWPLGERDTLIAVVGMDGKTAAWDESAPAGKHVWYRVFCVRHTADGFKVLAASRAKSMETPKAEPAPEPVALGLEVASEGGNAVLHWDACHADPFSHYRIVRTSGDSSLVVAEIENAAVTTWTDESVEVGGTYGYKVQCKGHVDGTYPLLGSSDVVAVTIE